MNFFPSHTFRFFSLLLFFFLVYFSTVRSVESEEKMLRRMVRTPSFAQIFLPALPISNLYKKVAWLLLTLSCFDSVFFVSCLCLPETQFTCQFSLLFFFCLNNNIARCSPEIFVSILCSSLTGNLSSFSSLPPSFFL